MNITAIDIVGLIIITLLAIRGMFKGFLTEFTAKAGLIVGGLTAIMFTNPVAGLLKTPIERYNLGIWGSVIIFILLAVAGFFGMKFFLSVAKDIFSVLHLNLFDYILGFAFGALEGTAICTILLFILRFQNMFDLSELLASSVIFEYLTPVLLFLVKFSIKEQLTNIL